MAPNIALIVDIVDSAVREVSQPPLTTLMPPTISTKSTLSHNYHENYGYLLKARAPKTMQR